MSRNPLNNAAARLDARLNALHGYRAALVREDNRVKLLLEDCGLPVQSKARSDRYEADPAWRQARDRYRAAVASAERAWYVLHPESGYGL